MAVSIFGLALVPLLLLQPNLQADQSPLRRPLVGAHVQCSLRFGHSCGVLSGQMPYDVPKTSRFPRPSENHLLQRYSLRGTIQTAKNSEANRIAFRGSVFCAACTGLLIGAIAAMAGIVLFSLGFFSLGAGTFGFWQLEKF